ncbi:spore germination protein [Bacillus velezensis]|nr:spore germination protein [Bacillus velezensis]
MSAVSHTGPPSLRSLYGYRERAKSKVAVIFVENIANPEIVEEVKRRLSYLRIDSVLAPGIIEESIEDNSFSIFPQIIHTERPDKAKACVMEGCVLIMMDGSPSALIAPITFFSFFNLRTTTARGGFLPVFKSAEIFRLYDRDYAPAFISR